MEEVLRRPAVGADDVEQVLRVHLDRVHDAVRRLGVDAVEAVDVVRRSAVALVEAVASRPEQVPDAAGWWFAEARRLARGRARDVPDLPLGRGLLSTDDDQLVLAEALEELPEPERLAVLLRDAYRLPAASVAAALGTGEDEALALVGRARLRAVPLLHGEPAPAVPDHGHPPAALARLAEGAPVAPRDATARRHVQVCAGCAAVTCVQERVHLRLSGLAVVAPSEAVRAEVLRSAERRARLLLPAASSPAGGARRAEDGEARLALSPLPAAAALLVAVAVGTLAGVVSSRGADAVLPVAADAPPAVTLPPVEPAPPISLAGDLPPPPPIPTPRTTVYYLAPRTPAPTPPRTPTPTPSATPSPAGPQIAVEPSSGGTRLAVTGTRWAPGSRVVLEQLDGEGRPTGPPVTVPVAADGSFTAELVAGSPAPRTVRAREGERTASADVAAAP